MALITLSRLGKHFDGPHLFQDVTLEVEAGRKIGVIGVNGSGKSTLLQILAGHISPSEGEVFRRRGLRIAYQAQEWIGTPGRTVRDEMCSIFSSELEREVRLRELEEELTEERGGAEEERLLREYTRLQEEQEATDGYAVEQRIASTLSGLGLPPEAWDQPVDDFSGGERNIIALARVILEAPDVILLDEPSNHLDMESLEWFIRWMRSSSATIVMITHDRHLLDLTVGWIWELDGGGVTSWTGNYGEFSEQKEAAIALQERQFKTQQRTVRRLRFQARRLRDMANAYDDPGQAKRAQSILKRIEQMDLVEKPQTGERSFRADLKRTRRHGRIALTIDGFSFSYGDKPLFENASLEIEYGQRVCLVGANGSGKSTLIREVIREGAWENPILRLGKSVRIGDYNQIHQEVLVEEQPIVEWLMSRTGLLFQPATELLHRFLFRRDDLHRPIATLSGGEKSRLQLARLVHEEVNFLILDEPTNHLDIRSCEQLESSLEEFEGTLLIISHDRYFLDKLVDHVVEIRDRKLVRHPGAFEPWWQARHAELESRSAVAPTLSSRKERAAEGKSDNQLQLEARKARQRDRRRLERRVREAEERVLQVEERREAVSIELEAACSSSGNEELVPSLAAELKQLQLDLPRAMKEWEGLAEELESDPSVD
jgi:ATP-binding cassette, subfamily F, member 3